jgi:hypothetical protein
MLVVLSKFGFEDFVFSSYHLKHSEATKEGIVLSTVTLVVSLKSWYARFEGFFTNVKFLDVTLHSSSELGGSIIMGEAIKLGKYKLVSVLMDGREVETATMLLGLTLEDLNKISININLERDIDPAYLDNKEKIE